jgi:hypothetical protein
MSRLPLVSGSDENEFFGQDEQDEQDFAIRARGHPVNPVKR